MKTKQQRKAGLSRYRAKFKVRENERKKALRGEEE